MSDAPVPPNAPRSLPPTTRAMHLLFVAMIGLAAVGYLVGIDQGVPQTDRRPSVTDAPERAPRVVPAVPYAEFPDARRAVMTTAVSQFDALADPPDDLLAEYLADADDKTASLLARSTQRAYNGAPPVAAHPMDQLSSGQCIACHGGGLRISGVTASTMPHPFLANCQQCHVGVSDTFSSTLVVDNAFDGLPAPFSGDRAWTGAPPVVPHSTFMRDNCLACHGPRGKQGLWTSHPWRSNCLQCHAPSAILDQRQLATNVPAFLPPPEVIEGP